MRKFLAFSKVFFGLFLVFVICSSSWARSVPPEDAALMVEGWLSEDESPLGSKLGAVARVDMYGESGPVGSWGEALYYVVFLSPNGVVFVPADDLVEPVLAWQPSAGVYNSDDKGPFQTLVIADMKARVKAARAASDETKNVAVKPDGEKSALIGAAQQDKWNRLKAAKRLKAASAEGLDSVQRESSASALALSASVQGASSVSDTRVAPLLRTKWNQSSNPRSYNYYTPNNWVSGCVATATGQVMYYFKWPQSGVGRKSFSYSVAGSKTTGTTRGGDGNGGPYKWSEMFDTFTQSLSDSARESVGALLFDVGIAAGANYTSGETGAVMTNAASRLTDTFQYSNVIHAAKFNGGYVPIPNSDLIRMINPNLDAGLPVLLGITGTGGHAIVSDGYGYSSSTLYHHLNMGWGGFDDVWYALPDITTTNYVFNIVDECSYNIYTNGKGEIISGRVLDGAGSPVSGASVSLTGAANATTTTNDKGIFAFAKVPSNSSYTVSATKSGQTFGSKTVRTALSVGSANSSSHDCGNVWGVELAEGGTPDPDIPPGVDIPATGITVSPKTATINVGARQEVFRTVTPANTNDTILWSSSNSAVANVVIEGSRVYVAANSAGSATITARAKSNESVSDSLTVTVVYTAGFVPATGISVSPKTMTLEVGEMKAVTRTITPANVSEKSAVWSTGNENIADIQIGDNGVYIKGVGAGTTTITVWPKSNPEITDTMTVTVTAAPSGVPATSVTVSPSSLTLQVGQRQELRASMSPSNTTEKTLIWSSSNWEVVNLVIENNVVYVSGVKNGSATVTAKAGGNQSVFGSAAVTVGGGGGSTPARRGSGGGGCSASAGGMLLFAGASLWIATRKSK
ncbi:hypothetical protein AGMMS50276_15660 [Synergistales bacterium]|nr:hypothetical protein AGMMS50276_15660 [Synergistales bacterium]